MNKPHQQPTTIDIDAIAEDIYQAMSRPRPENFVTTKEKQIENMWHMYCLGYTQGEIGKVYGIGAQAVGSIFVRRAHGRRVAKIKRKS